MSTVSNTDPGALPGRVAGAASSAVPSAAPHTGPTPTPQGQPKPHDPSKPYYGTGRRKEAMARVFLKAGTGKFSVNRRPIEEYFSNIAWRIIASEPLKFTELEGQMDVLCTVKGGGVAGQADSVRMGLSRALSRFNPELRPRLRKSGFLTRDSRMKERKKYGQKGARKRFQFSKR